MQFQNSRFFAAPGGANAVNHIVEVNFGANAALDAALIANNGSLVAYGSDADATPRILFYALWTAPPPARECNGSGDWYAFVFGVNAAQSEFLLHRISELRHKFATEICCASYRPLKFGGETRVRT